MINLTAFSEGETANPEKNQCIIITTVGDNQELMNNIGKDLVEKKFCAGVQLTRVLSQYRWKDGIEVGTEFKLEIRTVKSLYKSVVDLIKSKHNYELCEISWRDLNGEPEFLNWIREEVEG